LGVIVLSKKSREILDSYCTPSFNNFSSLKSLKLYNSCIHHVDGRWIKIRWCSFQTIFFYFSMKQKCWSSMLSNFNLTVIDTWIMWMRNFTIKRNLNPNLNIIFFILINVRHLILLAWLVIELFRTNYFFNVGKCKGKSSGAFLLKAYWFFFFFFWYIIDSYIPSRKML
jgi:hypothetical protein